MFLVPSSPLPLVAIFVALFATPTLQQPNPIPRFIDFYCIGDVGNYTQGSPYQLSLDTLLSDLDSTSSSSYEIGSNTTVYGRYFCRHDLPLPVCTSCVHAATKQIVSSCPSFKEALVWFEQCTLLYLSNSTRLEAVDVASPYSEWYSPANMSDPGAFYPVLQDTLSRAIKEAAYGNSSDGLGTAEGNVSKLGTTLYSLAQCAPDRIGLVCERCLDKALLKVDNYFRDKVDVAFFYPNCQVRYSGFLPFYDVVPTPPPPPVTPVSKDPGGHPTPGKNWAIGRMSNSVLNVGIWMALSTLMLLGN